MTLHETLPPPADERVMADALRVRATDAVATATPAMAGTAGFGASAPAQTLDAHFGITAQAVADAATRLVWR